MYSQYMHECDKHLGRFFFFFFYYLKLVTFFDLFIQGAIMALSFAKQVSILRKEYLSGKSDPFNIIEQIFGLY